ncbi:MAG: hypothetical protein ACM3TR_18525 [Caulobacteraceae bacterium]
MNYNDNNKESQGPKNHSALKHALHMAICCGLPIIIIAALPFIARFSPKTGSLLGIISAIFVSYNDAYNATYDVWG